MHADEFTLIVEGSDGQRWPIHGPEAWGRQVRLAEGSVGELYDAPLSSTYQPRVGQAGSTYLAHRYLERHVVLNMVFFGDEWDRLEQRFRSSLTPGKDATLVVRTNLSGERRLTVRLGEGPTYQDGRDPYSQQVMQKQFSLTAADPWWREPVDYTDTYRFNGTNWVGDHVVVNNPTDVPAWPKWVLTSPAKYGLPDIPIGANHDQDRMVYLPFQPNGRTAVVDTDPLEEMIVANDGTLMWARMNGQFFQHPIPPFTQDTKLPVYVDPFPLLPFDLPYQWRVWIGQKLNALCKTMGVDKLLAMTSEEFGAKIATWLKEHRPDWVPEVPADWLAEMTATMLARLIRETWGRVTNIAGAEAQVRVERRWQRPWG